MSIDLYSDIEEATESSSLQATHDLKEFISALNSEGSGNVICDGGDTERFNPFNIHERAEEITNLLSV